MQEEGSAEPFLEVSAEAEDVDSQNETQSSKDSNASEVNETDLEGLPWDACGVQDIVSESKIEELSWSGDGIFLMTRSAEGFQADAELSVSLYREGTKGYEGLKEGVFRKFLRMKRKMRSFAF